MTLVRFTKKDDIPSDLRANAKEIGEGDDVQFEVDYDFDNSSLVNALSSERQTVKDLKARFKGIDDPDEARMLIQRAAEGKPDPDLAAKHEAAIKRLKGEHGTEVARITAQLESQMINSEATRILSDGGGNVRLLRPHVVDRLRVDTSDDGAKSVVVIDGDGKAALDRDGNAMTGKGLLQSLRDDPDLGPAFGTPADPEKGKIPDGDGGTGSAKEVPKDQFEWYDAKGEYQGDKVVSGEVVLVD